MGKRAGETRAAAAMPALFTQGLITKTIVPGRSIKLVIQSANEPNGAPRAFPSTGTAGRWSGLKRADARTRRAGEAVTLGPKCSLNQHFPTGMRDSRIHLN